MKCKTLLFILLFFPLTIFSQSVILRNMHVLHTKYKTQFIFNLSRKAHYHTFTMQHPVRFVVDLSDIKIYHTLLYHSNTQSLVQNFRYASHHHDVFRMVFTMKKGVRGFAKMRISKYHAQLRIIFRKSFFAKLPSPTQWIHNSVMSDIAAAKKLPVHDVEQKGTNRDVMIVIDPGHGGKDPGAIGSQGTKEKNVVLSISKKLRDWINQQPGYHAVLTRTGDYYLTLRQRLRIARKDKADMFVAIHADMWRNKDARGVSVFALSQRGATSEAARWFATRENASELMGGVNLNDQSHLLKSVLINLSQAATIRSSLQIGHDVMNAIKPIARLHHNRVEQAAFVVLKSPDIPSLLIETGFLSNRKEERHLNNQHYQTILSESIMQGICRYFSHYPPRNTWLSLWRDHPRQYARYANHEHA